LLGDVLIELEGEELFALEERIRKLAISRRRGPREERSHAAWALFQAIGGLSPAQAEPVIRAFSLYFRLVNLAEQNHRIRRARAHASAAAEPQRGSIAAVLIAMKQAGVPAERARQAIASLEITLTLTAHPSEVLAACGDEAWGNDPMVLRRYAEFMALNQDAPADELMRRGFPFFRNPSGSWRIARIFAVLLPDRASEKWRALPYHILPRGVLIDNVRVASDRDAALHALTEPAFDLAKTAMIEPSPERSTLPPHAWNTSQARSAASRRVCRASVLRCDGGNRSAATVTRRCSSTSKSSPPLAGRSPAADFVSGPIRPVTMSSWSRRASGLGLSPSSWRTRSWN